MSVSDLQQDHQARIAWPYKRTDKRVDFLSFESTGLCACFMSPADFDRQYVTTLPTPAKAFVPSLGRALHRAYIFDREAAEAIKEAFSMTFVQGKDLGKCTITELVELLNGYCKAIGLAPTYHEKSYRTKKQFIEAAENAAVTLDNPTPEQRDNARANSEAATKRLAGLSALKQRKAEEAAASKEQDIMATQKKTTVSKKPAAKKPAAPKAVEKKSTPKTAPVEKTTEKKVAKDAGEKVKRPGIGSFCMDLILKGKTTDEIIAAAHEKFGSRTSASSIAWYKNKLRGEGKLAGGRS